MPPALSRKTTRGPNYEASIQAARDLLEQDENFIVVNRQRFTDNLHALVVFSLQHRDLEAPLYGVLNHILMHYCLTVNVAGAGFSTSPQSVFGTDLGLNPDEFVGLLRSWRVPDFANIFAFLSSLTSDAPTASPILAFWCEVKPSQSGDWRQIEHQSHCRRLFFFNLFQLRTQAVHAFVHYPAERHWAFMVTGFYVTAVEFENPNWKKAKEARSRRGGASQPGTDSILSLRPDDLPIKIVFLAEPLFLGSLHQLQVNPLFLSFLRKASAHSRANFQPSFLQMGTNYELPRQLKEL
ncbi:hypothetical protein FA95DRAFT_995968 [Auriscalpium vulgare]|uniref:Uncharacterized protein n=1 Tax=Auriscalpium vulgare TaxID=40419 RepID=A0ACB8RX90_9AGAM|nr:hypothetical protein FA95DRAFT_995968 [Auriscalpium vulgare]